MASLEKGRPWYYTTAIRLAAGGGQTTRVIESCRALAQRRPTTLVAPVPPVEPIPGLTVRSVPIPARPPRELIFQTRLAREIYRMASRDHPGVIFTVAAALNLGAILAARRLGISCILELNGLPALEYSLERSGRSARIRALVYTLIAHLEGRLASGIVGVTPELAAEARRWGARHVYVAPNGVNPSRFTSGDRLAARRAWNLPAEAEVVGFVGNFAAWQGLDTLVRGVLQLLPNDPSLHLVLVGDGVERPHLEALAAPYREHFHFTGGLPYTQVTGPLSACDILAAPFAPIERNRRTGVSGLKVFEYLALARPVLGSRIPGMEFIEHDRLGRLFTPADPTDLATQLKILLELPPAERVAMGQRARAAAEGPYCWEHIIDGLIAFAEGL